MAGNDFVPIDRQWRTEEIDPRAIAHALRGELTESHDLDSLWHINLYYGRAREEGPVFVLKLHPELRKVFLCMPSVRWRGHKTYLASVKLRNIFDIGFAEFTNPDAGNKETDVLFYSSGTSGARANNILVSSMGHRIGGDED